MKAAWLAPLLAIAGSITHAPPPPETSVFEHMLFVVVKEDAPGATFARNDYEAVLRRSAELLDRETLHRVKLAWRVIELPFGDAELGYGVRTFREWFDDLRDATRDERYDMLAFAPDRPLPFCTDAHSLGVVFDGIGFTCLESPAPLPLASNLLIHKIFHTFGFFHQQLRNKQYRLLDWELGLPAYTDGDVSFVSPTALGGSFTCAPGDRPEECRDVMGPFSRDVDGDGVRDDVDGYPASPPRAGPDSDGDGIPDALDLCPGNAITVTGDVSGGPMNFRATGPTANVTVTSGGAPLDVRWVAASIAGDKPLGDLMYFDEARETASGALALPRGIPVRARVVYEYRGARVRRSFYVYGERSKTSPGPWGYFDEREWLYFGRFGCDPPASLRIDEPASYDANADGLPDALDLAGYDWDGDGVPDRDDTLPTVAGHCANAHVRGVKDSDGDGFCDPGRFVFGALPPSIDRATYFGELAVTLTGDPDADRCPYRAGTNQGCPQ